MQVLANQNDQTQEGSLFWLLKQTKTAFGARLLRHWVTHPLLDKARIAARHDAVEELIGTQVSCFTGTKVEILTLRHP
jgi:DNA mismatch repair protein MSH3